jgi:hypothetical protein
VSRDDVHHAADRVRAVQRRPCGPRMTSMRSMDPGLKRLRSNGVRDLDPVDVDLGIAQAERARAANARVRAEHARRRLRTTSRCPARRRRAHRRSCSCSAE